MKTVYVLQSYEGSNSYVTIFSTFDLAQTFANQLNLEDYEINQYEIDSESALHIS